MFTSPAEQEGKCMGLDVVITNPLKDTTRSQAERTLRWEGKMRNADEKCRR